MKLHNMILIGMAVGVVAGYLLGPDSPLFDGEIVVMQHGRAPALYDGPDGERLEAPARDVRARVATVSDGWAELVVVEGLGRERVYARQGALPAERYSGAGLAVLSVLSLIGDIFLRLLKMLVVPLVIVSLSAGVASLGDPRQLGKMGATTLGFFFLTTAVSVSIGIGVALTLRPGHAMPEESRERLAGPEGISISPEELPGFAERLRQMVPENPLQALAEGDMLQVIFFAVMLGAALCLMAQEKAHPMVRLLEAATHAMVRMVHMVMVIAPIGVAAMMAAVTASSGLALMLTLAFYALVVLIGLFLHVALAYVPAVRLLAGVPLRTFFRAARPAQLLTFGTSSSSAALPVTMECSQKGLGISRHVTSFVLPVGSTVNMDGTALYQGVATVFVAQLYGLDLTAAQLVQVVLMATLASVGAAGVPGAGMVTLTMVLTSLGLPVEGVAIIMGVDRILDMFRSAVNVTGDLTCTAVVARLQGERPGTRVLTEPIFDTDGAPPVMDDDRAPEESPADHPHEPATGDSDSGEPDDSDRGS